MNPQKTFASPREPVIKWQPIESAPDKRILVWDGDMIHVAWLSNGVWQGAPYAGDEPLAGVTHWMPLPKPPKVRR